MGRGRTGGNPDFGTKYVFQLKGEEPRTEVVSIRFTPTMLKEIKSIAGDNYRAFCLNAIATELKRYQGEV